MAVTTEPRAGRPPGLRAATVAEAFQSTAHAYPDRVALRTKGDELSITWREYADRVEATAAGLAGLGLGRGDTLALMLTNRPEFHWFDAAVLHLGATPFSLYNTYTAEQIQHQVDDAGARILVEKASDRLLWGSDWPHAFIKTSMPNDGDLFDLFTRWVPDEEMRGRILVTNPQKLYDFPAA